MPDSLLALNVQYPHQGRQAATAALRAYLNTHHTIFFTDTHQILNSANNDRPVPVDLDEGLVGQGVNSVEGVRIWSQDLLDPLG